MTNQTEQHFFLMDNIIQHYPWGSKTSIQQLFNIKNLEQQPQAELWMGAHPNGCSSITVNGEKRRLSDVINQDKNHFLSPETNNKFGELPYLFKVLAAESALSIQVHPNKQQAVEGYAKEEAAGIEKNAFNRNYKDDNHKPELVYALTHYQAMNGFREFNEILELFKEMALTRIQPLVSALEKQTDSEGLKTFFTAMLSLESKEQAVAELLEYTKSNGEKPLCQLINTLSTQYPGDIGLFTPLMLNVITLHPGEAMYLDACTPHAYLRGTGLEIMANSDNVLRAGLTPKFIDVNELTTCTEFRAIPFNTLLTQPKSITGGADFPIPVDDFKFSIYQSITSLPLKVTSAEILLALDSEVTLNHQSGESITISKGESIFIPAYTSAYDLTSEGKVARAYN